jgi:hypothetical protein
MEIRVMGLSSPRVAAVTGIILVLFGLFISPTWGGAILILAAGIICLVYAGFFFFYFNPKAEADGKRITKQISDERDSHPCPSCGSPTFPPTATRANRYCYTCNKEVFSDLPNIVSQPSNSQVFAPYLRHHLLHHLQIIYNLIINRTLG